MLFLLVHLGALLQRQGVAPVGIKHRAPARFPQAPRLPYAKLGLCGLTAILYLNKLHGALVFIAAVMA